MKRTVQLEFVEEAPHSELQAAMCTCLADTVVFYFKAHGYHWNVEGKDFGPFHTFFELIYSEVYGTVDKMAEEIRALGYYALYTLAGFEQYRTIQDTPLGTASEPLLMVSDLLQGNLQLIANLKGAQELAEEAGKVGLANYLQDRVDQHEKHGWMLRSFLK
jgi:starvation-inducible DNA-binding protein